MGRCQSLPLRYLQMLSTLRALEISRSSNVFQFLEAENHIKYQFPVESLVINEWNASGKELTHLLTYFPKLSELRLFKCQKQLTGLGVNVRGQWETKTRRVPSSLANKVEQQQQQGTRAEDDVIVISEEAEHGLLLLPPQLQELNISKCPELSLLCSNPHDDSNEKDGRSRGGREIQGLTSLRQLSIIDCPKVLSTYSSSSLSSSFPFPISLEHLGIYSNLGTEMLLPLSNLTSLTSLTIWTCGDLRNEGWLSLLAQGHVTKLCVRGTPNFFVDSEPSRVHEQVLPPRFSKLNELQIDDVAGFTAAFIHRSMLFSSLTKLEISEDNKVERFTDQQEALLFVNSLKDIAFHDCPNLQFLPERLHRLPNFKWLHIDSCKSIQMLPKDGLPSSLQELAITDCPKFQSLSKDCLPDSLQKLVIKNCPAIQSLPEVDDLPSSLQELDVHEELRKWYIGSYGNSEELRSQCRRFINIVPIVRI